MTKVLLASTASLLALAIGGIAHAEEVVLDDQQTTRVGDIVVTAQRREQASQDVGVSLSVIGGEQPDKIGRAHV